jgi:hypothetical protein
MDGWPFDYAQGDKWNIGVTLAMKFLTKGMKR